MENEKKVLFVNDDPTISAKDLMKLAAEVSVLTGTTGPSVSEIPVPQVQGMTCMVTGCKKTAQFGHSRVALC